jgi:hypothetical protein
MHTIGSGRGRKGTGEWAKVFEHIYGIGQLKLEEAK